MPGQTAKNAPSSPARQKAERQKAELREAAQRQAERFSEALDRLAEM